jgi:aerobic carbon-monoxide dehydrogenase medium subunit
VAKRSNGGVEEAAISLVSMGATPLRAGAAEAAWNAGEDPGAVAAAGTDPPSDTNGSADYRRHLVQVLVRRAVEEAGRR